MFKKEVLLMSSGSDVKSAVLPRIGNFGTEVREPTCQRTTNAGASTAILTAQGSICVTQATPTGQGEQSGARAKG